VLSVLIPTIAPASALLRSIAHCVQGTTYCNRESSRLTGCGRTQPSRCTRASKGPWFLLRDGAEERKQSQAARELLPASDVATPGAGLLGDHRCGESLGSDGDVLRDGLAGLEAVFDVKVHSVPDLC
jgi:hypothetical protein